MRNGNGEAEATIPSPTERCHVAVEDHPGSYDEDLAWIIRQFKERVQGSGLVVTIHYAHGRAPEVVVADCDDGPSVDAFHDIFPTRAASTGEALMWHDARDDFPWHTLTMDMATNQCSRAVISVFYPAGSAAERAQIEHVASRFRPVLTGYFKLWLLHRSTSRRMQAIIAALAPVDFGVIVLDRDARIVFENPAAASILDEGSALYRCRGSVCARDTAASVRLRVAIDEALSPRNGLAAAEGASPLVFMKRLRQSTPLVAAVAAVEQPNVGEYDPAAVIHLFQPPTALDQTIAPACEWYNLSPMETRLVMMLVAGGSVVEMAAKENIKQDTVRTYLKNVFRKTNTKSQADLVRAMLTNSVRLRKMERQPKRMKK